MQRLEYTVLSGAEFRFADDEGVEEGLGERVVRGDGSTFEDPVNHDMYGSIFAPNAFDNSIAAHARGFRIKFLRDHDPKRLIGLVTGLRALARSLEFDGEVLTTPLGDESLILAKGGALDVSIGWFTRDYEWVEEVRTPWGTPVRRILEADLREISLVALPGNPNAVVTEVRDAHQADWHEIERARHASQNIETARGVLRALDQHSFKRRLSALTLMR